MDYKATTEKADRMVKNLIERTKKRTLRWKFSEDDDRYSGGSPLKQYQKTTFDGMELEMEQRPYESDGYGMSARYTLKVSKAGVTTTVQATESELMNLWNTIANQPGEELLDEFESALNKRGDFGL